MYNIKQYIDKIYLKPGILTLFLRWGLCHLLKDTSWVQNVKINWYKPSGTSVKKQTPFLLKKATSLA